MENTKNRELRMIRTFKTPIELMWKVWTDPSHIVNWWGPNGFTNTIQVMDFKKGGEWKLTMHGPDGTNYPNRSIFNEIVPFKKIVFTHYNPNFATTVLFNARGEDTEIDWSLVFETEEMRNIVVEVHKADEGQKQNADRLENYLRTLST